MRLRTFWVLLPAVLISNLAALASESVTEVRILFTNNSNGKLVNCNCRNDPFGGLAERVSYITEYRAEHPDILLLDSGGYFGLSDVDKKGPVVLQLMDILKYQAWGVGDQELYGGLDTFLAIAEPYRKNIINASLYGKDGRALFTPHIVITVKHVRIGITGLASDETFRYFPKERMTFICEHPDTTLSKILPVLKGLSDYIIVLSQMGVEADKRLAESWQDIDLIIGGHSQTLLKEAVNVSGAAIVQAGKNGGRLGEVVIGFDGSKKVKQFSYRLLEVTKKYTITPDIQILLDTHGKEHSR